MSFAEREGGLHLSDLSIVIPSYNSSNRLRDSLSAIQGLDDLRGIRFEVIVVDDGSDDDTKNVLRDFGSALPRLSSIFHPRDAASCRARARNLGLLAAVGETLLFLDAGVLPSAALLRRAHESSGGSSEGVMYKTLGLFAGADSLRALPGIASLPSSIGQLATSTVWEDVREPYMENGCRVQRYLPAPWLLAWTCALSVPRGEAVAVGGFDESFMGWGAEDVEFAGRLAARGLRFVWGGNDAVAIHVPHSSTDDRQSDHCRNARRVHAKLCTRESELFALWMDGISANLFGLRLDQLFLDGVTPPVAYSSDDVPNGGHRRLLCSGLRPSASLAGLNPVVAVAHEPALAAMLGTTWPRARVHCLVGFHLPYADGEFDDVLIGDFVRVLPAALRQPYLQEMGRVGNRVSVLLSTRNGYQHRYRQVGGWDWCSVNALAAVACTSGLKALGHRVLNSETVLLTFTREACRAESGAPLFALDGACDESELPAVSG